MFTVVTETGDKVKTSNGDTCSGDNCLKASSHLNPVQERSVLCTGAD
ncbi:unnamed protein product [Staurois parvus]|uniref:Uncharacterized protein n=1 Tax=Staurois parvus TaxID=386267 RepID=A0ABN9FF86_9NEOB|nr:unnamed protein product [Staurois parvus]